MSEQSPNQKDLIEVFESILEHEAHDTQSLAVAIDKLVKAAANVVMWVNLLLIGAIVSQVGMRYLLNQNYPKIGRNPGAFLWAGH